MGSMNQKRSRKESAGMVELRVADESATQSPQEMIEVLVAGESSTKNARRTPETVYVTDGDQSTTPGRAHSARRGRAAAETNGKQEGDMDDDNVTYTIADVMKKLNIPETRARDMFKNEPGVLRLIPPGYKRAQLRIPRDVYERVVRRCQRQIEMSPSLPNRNVPL